MLRLFLHTHHNREYQDWNRHIESFGPHLDELIAGPVASALPNDANRSGLLEWIRSHLTGVYLEYAYSSISEVRLAYNQAAWYKLGHFPCGWFVDRESAFPEHAVTVLY